MALDGRDQLPDQEVIEVTDRGREHAERRAAQAAAARKHTNRKRALKRPGKSNRSNWKKEL